MAYRRSRTVEWTDQVTGKRRSKTLATERLARQFQADREKEEDLLQAGSLSVEDMQRARLVRTPTTEAIAKYRAALEARSRRRPEHREAMLAAVESVVRWARIEQLSDLTPRAVVRALRRRRADAGWSSRTYNHYRSAIFGFAAWLSSSEEEAYLPENPLEPITPAEYDNEERTPSRPLTVAQVRALLDATPSPRRRLLYLFRLRTGVRGSECKRLRWGDVDLRKRLLSLRADVTKNRQSDVLPLADDLCDELAVEQAASIKAGAPTHADDLLFPSIPDRRTWKRDLDLAGIPYLARMADHDQRDGRADPKCLRPTFDSFLQRSGADLVLVMLLLRHTAKGGLKTMLRHYSDGADLLRRKRETIDTMVRWHLAQDRKTKRAGAGA